VASGHYHASKVPDIPGLKEWKQAWPDRVHHSKGYRNPEDFKDQVNGRTRHREKP
jgi:cation diffusion facilitator CzcD-associated flavoprotein CzcO